MLYRQRAFLDFLDESNLIETEPRANAAEIDAAGAFIGNWDGDRLTLAAWPDPIKLAHYVLVTAGAPMRVRPGDNVSVGTHVAPLGGPDIRPAYEELLTEIGSQPLTIEPFDAYMRYEDLHPFMDGNGRSGRLLWLWHVLRRNDAWTTLVKTQGFLRVFHYMTFEYRDRMRMRGLKR